MTNVRRLGCQIPSHVAAFSHLQLFHGHIKMRGHCARWNIKSNVVWFEVPAGTSSATPVSHLTLSVSCAEALAFSSNLFKSVRKLVKAWSLSIDRSNTIQRKYLASSRIMQLKGASNVTLHVFDILLMPIDETVRTYSHLLLTHWSRPTVESNPSLQHSPRLLRQGVLDDLFFVLLAFLVGEGTGEVWPLLGSKKLVSTSTHSPLHGLWMSQARRSVTMHRLGGRRHLSIPAHQIHWNRSIVSPFQIQPFFELFVPSIGWSFGNSNLCDIRGSPRHYCRLFPCLFWQAEVSHPVTGGLGNASVVAII